MTRASALLAGTTSLAAALTLAGCGGGGDGALGATPTTLGVDTQSTEVATTAASADSRQQIAALTPLGDWPRITSAIAKDPAIESKIDALVASMTLEEKVGQMTQPEIQSITAAEIKQYHIGSVLNGGGVQPYGADGAPVSEWLRKADELWTASTQDRLKIPLIWGTDAVHGHNVKGATVFPQNIGLGAARDPALVKRIGEVTALEVARTGIDWAFAPVLAVVRDDRWGRTYEGFSEDPEITASYGAPVIQGLQGQLAKDTAPNTKVIATAKHYLGDGGTVNGTDQGITNVSEADLINIHARGYYAALQAGAQTVMASFSSWKDTALGPNGKALKMHGNAYLLTEVLKNKMGFDGFVVSDWNGISQITKDNSASPRDCTSGNCPQAINAGVDMAMVPGREDWLPFITNTLASVRSGEIPQARIDDAVRRILRVKFRSGVMTKPKPSARLAVHDVGTPEHRAVAREAVRKSMVLLKNNGSALPIARTAKILVAGKSADSLANQSGGWTVSWQGGNPNADFGGGTTLWSAVKKVAPTAVLDTSELGDKANASVDVAIVGVGETAYAEWEGDLGADKTLELAKLHPEDIALIKSLKAKGVKKIVTVLFAGRPMYVNQELNRSDAFVAAFLPGTEGDGITDVLFQKAGGGTNVDFSGKLSYSWPRSACQTAVNRNDAAYSPLYAYGYGLGYAAAVTQGSYDESSPALGCGQTAGSGAQPLPIFDRSNQGNWKMRIGAESGWDIDIAMGTSTPTRTPGNEISVLPVDNKNGAQWGALKATWTSAYGELLAADADGLNRDLTSYAGSDAALVFDVKVSKAPTESVDLRLDCGYPCVGQADATATLRALPLNTWSELSVSVQCLAARGATLTQIDRPFLLGTSGSFEATIANVRWVPNKSANVPCSSQSVPLEFDADAYVDGTVGSLFSAPVAWLSNGTGTATLDSQFVADGAKVIDVRIANQKNTGGNAGFLIGSATGSELDVSKMTTTGGVQFDIRVLDYGGTTQGFWTKLVCKSDPDNCTTGDLTTLIGRPAVGTWKTVKLPFTGPNYAGNGFDAKRVTSIEVLPAWDDQAGNIHFQVRNVRVKKSLN